MPADDLLKEYGLFVQQVWSEFTSYAVTAVKEELPLPGEISKAGKGQPNTHLNWATGALRNSVTTQYKTDYVGRSITSRGINAPYRYDKVGPTLKYAYTYANGSQYIPTYHGYDFIAAAKDRIEGYGYKTL